jgi:hypothetical protein
MMRDSERIATLESENDRLRLVLAWIAQERYCDRDTVGEHNAWPMWQKLNKRMIEIIDRAQDAVLP